MDLFLGGYYLVEEAQLPKSIDRAGLPETLCSPSDQVCSLHPPSSSLSWTNDDSEEYQSVLGLEAKRFRELQNQVDKWFNENKYGWGGAFIDLSSARTFYHQWLNNNENVHLIAIATTLEFKDELLPWAKPRGNAGATAMYYALTKELEPDSRWMFRGFDVLGYDYGFFQHIGYFGGAPRAFTDELEVEFNEYGQINDYRSALNGANFMRQPNNGDGLLWQVWAVYEVPFYEYRQSQEG